MWGQISYKEFLFEEFLFYTSSKILILFFIYNSRGLRFAELSWNINFGNPKIKIGMFHGNLVTSVKRSTSISSHWFFVTLVFRHMSISSHWFFVTFLKIGFSSHHWKLVFRHIKLICQWVFRHIVFCHILDILLSNKTKKNIFDNAVNHRLGSLKLGLRSKLGRNQNRAKPRSDRSWAKGPNLGPRPNLGPWLILGPRQMLDRNKARDRS